jgi:glucose/arabinose dehydrogenase
VLRVTPAGAVATFVANLVSPVDLAFAPGGAFGTDLYVSDAGAGTIVRINDGGTATTFASGLKAPFGLAFSTTPLALWSTDYSAGNVVRIR